MCGEPGGVLAVSIRLISQDCDRNLMQMWTNFFCKGRNSVTEIPWRFLSSRHLLSNLHLYPGAGKEEALVPPQPQDVVLHLRMAACTSTNGSWKQQKSSYEFEAAWKLSSVKEESKKSKVMAGEGAGEETEREKVGIGGKRERGRCQWSSGSPAWATMGL